MVMPITGTPRVIIQERESESPITGSDSISAALFIGQTAAGPGFQVHQWNRDNPPRPVLVVSWDEYVRTFGRQLSGSSRFQADIEGAYVSHAVRGFFDNGGKRAWILRLTTEVDARWEVRNASGNLICGIHAGGGSAANALRLQLENETNTAVGIRVPEQATISGANSLDPARFDLQVSAPFAKGDLVDVVMSDGTIVGSGTILELTGNTCLMSPRPPISAGYILKLSSHTKEADGAPPATFRIPTLISKVSLATGTLVEVVEPSATAQGVLWGVVERVDTNAVLVTRVTGNLNFYKTSNDPRALELRPHSFKVSVIDSGAATPASSLADLALENVSLIQTSPRFLGTLVTAAYADGSNASGRKLGVPLSVHVETHEPPLHLNALVPQAISPAVAPTPGVDDSIGKLTIDDYRDPISTLGDFEDAKLIVAPDTAVHPFGGFIQQLLRDHCETRGDRFALLDAPKDVHSRDDLITRVRELQSDGGFAAFYYPWIKIAAPRGSRSDFIFVPPSGHIAGLYARVDTKDGVHKSPANEVLRGALDVERRLGDVSQDPLHDECVNVLRVFPGTAAVNVFGARTAAPKDKLNFRYIAVRRLFLFVEDALKRSLRGTIYEPNEPSLWKALTRNISEFLSRVESSGALFATADRPGFYVHISEGNNPESQRKQGILTIEIGLRPSYPAEYIVVDIGIWDGQVTIGEA